MELVINNMKGAIQALREKLDKAVAERASVSLHLESSYELNYEMILIDFELSDDKIYMLSENYWKYENIELKTGKIQKIEFDEYDDFVEITFKNEDILTLTF